MTPEQRSAEGKRRLEVARKNRNGINASEVNAPSLNYCPHCGHSLEVYAAALRVAHQLTT